MNTQGIDTKLIFEVAKQGFEQGFLAAAIKFGYADDEVSFNAGCKRYGKASFVRWTTSGRVPLFRMQGNHRRYKVLVCEQALFEDSMQDNRIYTKKRKQDAAI